MRKIPFAIIAIAPATMVLAGCGSKVASTESVADSAAEIIEGDPASAWIELTGRWARADQCGDYASTWVIEADAFHVNETHCKIENLQLLRNGVRAVAHCSVEGDDDGQIDAFRFVRQPDATLSIVNEANGYSNDGLGACDADMIP